MRNILNLLFILCSSQLVGQMIWVSPLDLDGGSHILGNIRIGEYPEIIGDVELGFALTKDHVEKVDSLPQNFINLIGHDYRDKTISTSELAIVRGFNVFFGGERQKNSSDIEYRLRIMRNDEVVFCNYSKSNQFSNEVRSGITMSAPGDILIIDEVLLKKDEKSYSILGVELEVL